MLVVVDREAADPVYGQIARQIRVAIAGGKLRAGSALPAVRTLASDLGVNLNTVARAYRQLQEEGFLDIRARTGAVVVAPPALAAAADRRRLRAELAELLARMRQSGLSPIELREIFDAELSRLGDGRPAQEKGG